MTPTYRIRDWSKHFENNRTRELKELRFVILPNKHDGDGYTELLDHPNGAAHYGAWVAIVQVASKCDPRGTLLRDGARSHDPASLSRLTRLPEETFREAIPRLIEIGWLEPLPEQNQQDSSKSQDGAALSTAESRTPLRESALEGNGIEGNRRELNGKEDVCANAPPCLRFPIIRSKNSGETEWLLTDDLFCQLTDAFEAVDVPAECKKALAWVHANKPKRKTASGMPNFLYRWMTRVQNNGGGSRYVLDDRGRVPDDFVPNNPIVPPPISDDEKAQLKEWNL